MLSLLSMAILKNRKFSKTSLKITLNLTYLGLINNNKSLSFKKINLKRRKHPHKRKRYHPKRKQQVSDESIFTGHLSNYN